MSRLVGAGLILACALAACTTAPPRTSASGDFLMLAEVAYVLTRYQIVAEAPAPDHSVALIDAVRAEGLDDADIAAGRVVALRFAIAWANTVSGRTHAQWSIAIVPRGLAVDPGNVIELRSRPSRLPRIERVRALDLKSGGCRYVEQPDPLPLQIIRDLVGLASLIGPGGTSTLECPGLRDEGWLLAGRHWIRPLAPATDPESDR